MIDAAFVTELATKFGPAVAVFLLLGFFLIKEYKAEKKRSYEYEQKIHEEAIAREDRLMQHLEKTQETQEKIAQTLEKLEFRIERLENNLGRN